MIAGDPYGDVFLVVDGWLTVRQDFEALEPTITELAARGLGYGIHVVAATNKWSEIRPSHPRPARHPAGAAAR